MYLIHRIILKLKKTYHEFFGLPKIKDLKLGGRNKLIHISAFSYGNAGDTILPVVLRDLFIFCLSIKSWKGFHVKIPVEEKYLKTINKADGIVIGGGGLFLRDSHPNKTSGWQWNCSIENLLKINKPIIMFAVGYNRFRNQEEFDPIFTNHLNEFVKKAKFVGIRNYGSIKRLKDYLEPSNAAKLCFQPCMTTLISKLYPNLTDYNSKQNFIAINCAFDRINLRIESEETLNEIARVAKELSHVTKIKYFSHMKSDEKILKYFEKYNLKYELVRFQNLRQIIKEYASARLVIGMRGHSQMIPFGCNTSILSIVTHNKLQYFLDDINQPDLGVDVMKKDFDLKLLNKALETYENYKSINKKLLAAQEKLYKITLNNLDEINKVLS
tara:strand:+ start:2617 stop:3768 length:1152 start_codon:yes stop_codon:yes gene_type:complete